MNPQVENAKEYLRNKWRAFRSETGFFQTKVWLVVAYVFVVLLTVVIAPPSSAKYSATKGSIPWGDGTRTFVDVNNHDESHELTLLLVSGRSEGQSGNWTLTAKAFAEESTIRIWASDLRDERGIAPSDDLNIDGVIVSVKDKAVGKIFMRDEGVNFSER